MITVTASPINTFAPVVDGAAATTSPTVAGAIVSEGFSTALNTQMDLLVAPATDVTATLTTQTSALLTAITTTPTTTEMLAAATTATALATDSTQMANTPTLLQTSLTTNASSANPTTIDSTATAMMSAEDSAILSTVTDTLKFITSGVKLGDTLPAGQSVQLPTANSATSLTQESMQLAVKQAVTNTQVNTAANILAQQVTPPASFVQTPMATATQVDTPVQMPVITTAQVDAPEQVQTSVTTATPEQVQTSATVVTQIDVPEQVQTTATTAMPEQVQTPVTTAMPEQVQTPVTTTSQSEGIAAEQTQNVQTQTAEKISAEVAPQVLIINPETTTVQTQTAPILTVDKPSADAAIEPQLANEALPSIANQLISDKQKISDTVTPSVTKSENKASEVNTPIVQVMTDAIVVPLVTTQATSVQVEPQKVAVETSSDTTTTDKPTLTSAKTLLMDAVASRNSSGDTANNGNNGNNGGNNTPSNPILQSDGLLNSATDNKQNAVDLKSFASLLTAEKTDVIGASITSAADKSAPQGVSTAVNKLIQDTKVDVPAMTKPISHPEWNQDMGERIVWMTNRGISSAEIKMNPQNMGPITVRIDMNQDQATIAFTAQNSEVRTALEASIPKLREMLSSQQVTLAEVNVSQQSTSNSNDSGRSQQQTAQMMADASANGQGNRQANQEVDAQGNPVTSNNNAEGISVDEFANGQVIETNGTNGLLSIYA